MPVQSAKSSLLAKYGAKLDSAAKKHAADPVEYGVMRLPPGINNGIAQLHDCKFAQVAPGKNNAGEWYFRATGVVITPKSVLVDGIEVPVEGQQTSVMEMICDTKTQTGKVTTLEDHVANIQNELKKLGASADDLAQGAAALEMIAKALEESKPYFKFSTSLRKAQNASQTDGIWENWYGVKGLENFVPQGAADPSSGVQDSGTDSSTNGHSTDGGGEGTPDSDLGQANLEALVTLAEGDPTGESEDGNNAIQQLKELALAAGLSEDQITNSESWTVLGQLIIDSGNPSDQPTVPADPESGSVFHYKIRDAKTKQPVKDLKTKQDKKPVECEVVSSDPKTKTVTLKDLATQKVLNGPDNKPLKIKWSDLEEFAAS